MTLTEFKLIEQERLSLGLSVRDYLTSKGKGIISDHKYRKLKRIYVQEVSPVLAPMSAGKFLVLKVREPIEKKDEFIDVDRSLEVDIRIGDNTTIHIRRGLNADMFVFVNKRRNRLKLLHVEPGELVICSKC